MKMTREELKRLICGHFDSRGEEIVRCVGRVIGLLKEEQIPTGEQLNRIEEAVRAGERRK